MTDLESPWTDRSETVSRVISALSSGTSDGALDRDALRDALASEGSSLLDLPEVGLWLALSEVALVEPMVTVDMTTVVVGDAVDDTVEVVELVVVEPIVDLRDLRDLPPPPDDARPVVDLTPVDPRLARPRRGRRRGRRGAPEPVSFVDAPVAEEPPSAVGLGDALRGDVLRAAPDPVALAIEAWSASPAATVADELRSHLDLLPEQLASLHLADPSVPGGATVDWAHAQLTRLHGVGDLDARVRSALAAVLPSPLPDPARVGTAVPAPYWPRPLVRSLAALADHLQLVLAEPLTVTLPDPSVGHGAPLAAYWRPQLVRRLDALGAFLDSRFALPTAGKVVASRQAGATNGAVPDAYWPRHLVRDLPHAPTSPPRSPDALEAHLHEQLDAVSLVGEADLDAVAAELEISLAHLLRRVPLDRLGRLYPATLAAFLVRQTALHPAPADFDAVPLTALRRSNPVGLAFSEALVRLDKPVFREVEQRDHFDHRLRYVRRMQLHTGITAAVAPAVVDAVTESSWSGAVTGREVAQDWLVAPGAVTAVIGEPAFRLLTCTDHGADMLEALVALVRWRHLDAAPASPPPALAPLPSHVVDAAWAHLAGTDAPERPWGEPLRPTLRLGRDAGSGPELVLPRSSARWHLNGELLAYGSPISERTAELPPHRGGRWTVSAGSSRRGSPLEVRLESAAADRVVLVFDERHRHHHASLPLGGTTATVIAPSGAKVSGATDRTLLVGRWVGFEEVTIDLAGLDELTIAHRGGDPLTIALDPTLAVDVLATADVALPGPLLAFRGHVPPAGEVLVVVDDGATPRSARLADPRLTVERGCVALPHLVQRQDAHTVTVTVERSGVAPVVRTASLAPQRRPAPSGPAPVRITADPRALAAVEASAEPTTRRPAELEALWVDDLVRAAAADRWFGEGDHLAVASSVERWERHTGWTPPADADAVPSALAALVAPLLEAVGPTEAPAVRRSDAPVLTTRAWQLVLGPEAGTLDDWARRFRRPIRQWRITRPALHNLSRLWARLDTADATAISPLVAVALLSFVPGDHQAAATQRLGEAMTLAPTTTAAVAVMAAAYAHVQRAHPASRFGEIAFD